MKKQHVVDFSNNHGMPLASTFLAIMRELKLTGFSLAPVTGFWCGGTEPSYRLSFIGEQTTAQALARAIRREFNQDEVYLTSHFVDFESFNKISETQPAVSGSTGQYVDPFDENGLTHI